MYATISQFVDATNWKTADDCGRVPCILLLEYLSVILGYLKTLQYILG